MSEPQHQQLEFNSGLTFTQKIGMVAGSVSALYLLPSGANAAIVHVTTPLSVSLGSSGNELWDVDNDGNGDFRLLNLVPTTNNTFSGILLNSNGLNGQGLVQSASAANSVVQKLNTSFNIGPNLATGYRWGAVGQSNRTVMNNNGDIAYPFSNGGFTSPGTGSFGFRFLSGGNTFYGWANIDIGQTSGTVTITEWAYNNTPDGTIRVGQTQDDPVTTPEPTSSLALLAFGAAGVYCWRKGKPNQAEDDEHDEDIAA